ncbi:MAG: ABC transporter ATP-binding protein [Chloroflexi bacterium]|nr:MAG: ABC transporter ATP-binding protein [Chloroflexota bacterium]
MLELKGLRLNINGKAVLDGLDLHVGRGEIHGLLGVNGTGKTTLANLIMGLISADEGRIVFEGQDITQLSISQRAKLGITLAWQEPARFEGLTVRNYLQLNGRADPEELEKTLHLVGLSPEEYLGRFVDSTLSGGERKRIELAAVMAMRPKLAILDEPDSGIDMISLPYIMQGVAEMVKGGSSVLLITHNESSVEIADRVSVICAGRIIQSGPPKEVCQWFKQNCQVCPAPNVPREEFRR